MFWTGLASSGGKLRRALHKWGVAVVVASGLATGAAVLARTPDQPGAVDSSVALATLPAEAQTTHRLILAGGPFPHSKDGTVFGNRERLLPRKARGYYREYTVRTPGSRDRGARRIVCGGQAPKSQPQPATESEACFYTDDHYASFKRIAP